MLIWLASYPRSGNTFVRVVLNDVFGIKTPSLSGEGDFRVFSSRAGVVDAVGHQQTTGIPADLVRMAQRSQELTIIKTHEPPATDDPAIYIVRDGRSAIISYWHYLHDVEHMATPIESIIDGDVYAGAWSDHFAAWNPLERPNTLLLRYEEITADVNGLIGRLRAFAKVEPVASGPRPFQALHQMHPEFFRKGSDAANIREMEPHIDRFIGRHGVLMHQLGYLP